MPARSPCVATVLNNDFVEYFLVFLHSIRKHNPWFKLPIIIFYSQLRSALSTHNQTRIRKAYKQVEFREVDESKYEHFKKDTPERLLPALFKLETFGIKGHNRVIFLDADMLCLGDISQLFTSDIDFGAVPAGKDRDVKERVANTFRRRVGFNSGVMVIGEKYLNDRTYESLFRYKSGPCADQDVLNRFFRFRKVYCFPHQYNYHAQFFWNGKNTDDVRILHFAGEKPLEKPELPRMKVWFEEKEEMEQKK
jgi:lipopolysaccharide biosynthesis glycosyltransferase